MALPAYIAQFAAPPCEQAQALRGIADFVAQIVRPAAEGIDVVEILMQPLGQQEADHVEILVVMGGQPARVARPRPCVQRARKASGEPTKSAGAGTR